MARYDARMEKDTFFFAAPLSLDAGGPDAQTLPSRFRGTAYSGAVIDDWGGRVVIDLASTRVEDSLPLLHEHRRSDIIGTITAAENDGRALAVEGELFADIDQAAAEIVSKAQRGIRYQMSVGLFGARAEDVPADAAPLAINGQSLTGPLTVLRGGLVREVSVVTLGADLQTNAAFFSARTPSSQPTQVPTMPEDNDLQARVDALQAQVSDLAAERDAAIARATAAESALTDVRLSARKSAVQALFAELGRSYSDETAAHYLSLSDAAWTAVAGDLRSLKPSAPAYLFSQQVTGEPSASPSPSISTEDIYARYHAAQRGGKAA